MGRGHRAEDSGQWATLLRWNLDGHASGPAVTYLPMGQHAWPKVIPRLAREQALLSAVIIVISLSDRGQKECRARVYELLVILLSATGRRRASRKRQQARAER